MDKDWGDEGEGEMSGESSMEAYTLTYVNRWPMEIFYMTQRTQIGLCNNLEGWEWVKDRREIYERGDTCTPMVNSCWMYDRNQTDIVKKSLINLK